MSPSDPKSPAPAKPRVLATYWPEPKFLSNRLGAKPGKPIELQRKDPPWAPRLGSNLKETV